MFALFKIDAVAKRKRKKKANDGWSAQRVEDYPIKQEWKGVNYGIALMGTRVSSLSGSSYFPYF